MKIIPDKKHPNMYRLEWPNGDISVSTPNPGHKEGHYGFYNLTMAKELSRRVGIENYTVGITYNDPLARSKGV